MAVDAPRPDAQNRPMAVTIVERPDPGNARWNRFIQRLLDAAAANHSEKESPR
jgi:hypothetical protein